MSILSRKRPSKEEITQNNKQISKICKLFSKTDFPSTKTTDLSEDQSLTHSSPKTPSSNSLTRNYLSVYQLDYQQSFIKLKSQQTKISIPRFDNRRYFYDKIIPIFHFLRLKNQTIFRVINYIEEAFSHSPGVQLLNKFKKDLENGKNSIDKFFEDWLFSFAIPCIILACEAEEIGHLNWKSKVKEACDNQHLPFPNALENRKLELFLTGHVTPYSLIYSDFFNHVFSEMTDVDFDFLVIRDLAEQLILQQLMYDYCILGEVNKENVMQAAMNIVFKELIQQFKALDSIFVENKKERSNFECLKLRLREFPTVQSPIIEGIFQQMKLNICELNDGDGDEDDEECSNIRHFVTKCDFFDYI